MKTFQKIALVSAIATASFATQAMEALDDSVLGNTTGQAGVTIDISVGGSGISIGEIEYKDEGSVLIQNVTVNDITKLTQTIDVDAEGNLLIGTTAVTGVNLALGDDGTGNYSAVALKGTNGTTEVVNNLNMTVDLGESTTQIMNLAGANSLATQAQADGFGAAAFEGSVAIRSTSSLEITDLDVGMFGYTRAQADAKSIAAGGAAGDATSDFYATSSAINISDVRFYGTTGIGSKATMDQVIWAKGGTQAQGAGLYIQMGEIAGTLEVGGIAFGTSPSIGTVKVSDINLAGMTTRIYGH
ncbi:hypothetical protein OLEAN_C20210 [Oleispira antarctica RB-8]|uniref:DUF6160 domain-containing protein n=1 Tax=Oleispira antarctica RB-8 TaxID=698738 RepID=R4YMS7_OLEAN|nr:hypothetical protein OLEAN_C20210 [Oleispira antarctica RB-8]